jgi:hypothetical protein
MKNEMQTTFKFVAAAAVTATIAIFAAPRVESSKTFDDQGQAFYPELNEDIEQVKGLQVYSFSEELGEVSKFEVLRKAQRWVIPSKFDYPADAVDQLAKVAGALFDLKKNAFVTDRPKDFEALGVLDPDPSKPDTGSLTGLGTRVNLLDGSGSTIASFIFGKEVPERSGFRYVRVPEKNRVYAVVVESVELSTRFSDWIETDLLAVTGADMTRIAVQSYEVDASTGQFKQGGELKLSRKDETWSLEGLAEGEKLSDKVSSLETALDELLITGVRPKPKGLRDYLAGVSKIGGLTRDDVMSLQSKGFYVMQEGGLVSNVGQLDLATKDGILYTLWFGELALGESGADGSIGQGAEKPKPEPGADGAEAKSGTDRYLLIMVNLDEAAFGPEPVAPSFEGLDDEAKKAAEASHKKGVDAWAAERKKASDKLAELNGRFADWYYVISDASYRKLRLERAQLVDAAATPTPVPTEPGVGPVVPGAKAFPGGGHEGHAHEDE